MVLNMQLRYRKLIVQPYPTDIRICRPRITGGDGNCNKYPQIPSSVSRYLVNVIITVYITRLFELRVGTDSASHVDAVLINKGVQRGH